MTQAELRRKYPALVRMVERGAHSKFKRKPTLVFVAGGRPRNECVIFKKRGTRTVILRVEKARILIPKRLARENPELAKLAICHEAREILGFQNNNSPSKSHRIARTAEGSYRKKLGIEKTGGYMIRKHYARARRRKYELRLGS